MHLYLWYLADALIQGNLHLSHLDNWTIRSAQTPSSSSLAELRFELTTFTSVVQCLKHWTTTVSVDMVDKIGIPVLKHVLAQCKATYGLLFGPVMACVWLLFVNWIHGPSFFAVRGPREYWLCGPEMGQRKFAMWVWACFYFLSYCSNEWLNYDVFYYVLSFLILKTC